MLAISLEATELLQILQWKTENEINELFADIANKRDILFELADININLLSLCDYLAVDLNQLTVEKCAMIVQRFQNREGVSVGENRNDIKCNGCNKIVKADWHYCANCGHKLIVEPR